MKFVNKYIQTFKEYIPGEQPPPRKNLVKLNTNENCFPPTAKIKKLLQGLNIADLRLYPDPHQKELVEVATKAYQLKKGVGIAFGNGADEIIRVIFNTFLMPNKDSVLLSELTYSAYETYANLNRTRIERLAMNEDLSFPLEKIKGTKSKVVFITNPNNPTGMGIAPSRIAKLAKENPQQLFIIDEAYADFAQESCLKFLPMDNLIVVKTLSKSFSACGLRIGFAIGNHDLIKSIKKGMDPFHIGFLNQKLGALVLSDQKTMKKNTDKIIKLRQWLTNQLEEMNFKVLPSKGNFLMCSPPSLASKLPPAKNRKLSSPAKELFLYLRQKNIYIRYFEKPIISNYVRITIGTQKDLNQLLKRIRDFYRI